MRVLFFISSLTGGGAERVTVGLANYLVRNGCQVSLVTMHNTDRDFYNHDSRVSRIYLNLAGQSYGLSKFIINWRRLRALRRVIQAEQPDVVVGMMPTATILCILACFGSSTRIVGSERNYPAHKPIGKFWGLFRRLLYRFADAHVAQTQEGADWIICHANARNVTVIPNAVPWPISSCSPYIDPAWFIPPDRRLILAVGSKSEQKGFDLLLDVYSRIARDNSDWDLAIVGLASDLDKESGSRDQLQATVEAFGLTKRVHFPGRVGNVCDWYERADLFVLSSRYEGFPNALLEAMASGCPSIAFDCDTGPRDIIEHEVNGLLVPAEDCKELQRCIMRLIGNDELRSKLGLQAVQVRNRFSEMDLMDQWVEILK